MNDHLDDLKQQRRHLASELSEIMGAQARLRAALDRETAALKAIGELGAGEAGVMNEWARGGCIGDPPHLDMSTRTKLAAELAQAQAQSEAARSAEMDLNDKQRTIVAGMQSIGMHLEDAALDALAARHQVEMANLDDYIERHLRPRMGLHFGLHGMLIEAAAQHKNGGNEERARALYQRAEALRLSYQSIDVGPSNADLSAGTSKWSRRFVELMTDQPQTNVVPIEREVA